MAYQSALHENRHIHENLMRHVRSQLSDCASQAFSEWEAGDRESFELTCKVFLQTDGSSQNHFGVVLTVVVVGQVRGLGLGFVLFN